MYGVSWHCGVSHGNPAARALAIAIAVGVLAAVVSDWRARAAVAALSIPVYLWVSPSAWSVPPWQFTPLIAVAVTVGAGGLLAVVPEGAAAGSVLISAVAMFALVVAGGV